MEQHDRRRRVLYRLAPLIFVVVCLGSINILSWWAGRQAQRAGNGSETAVLPNQTAVAPTVTIPPTFTPTAVVPPTLTPTATLPPSADIVLLGPPPAATLSAGQVVSFYWTWPLPLPEDRHFAVYWQSNGEELLLGTQNEPNLGSSYTVRAALPSTAANGNWQVRLETTATRDPIMSSTQRPLTIQSSPN